MNKKKKKNTFSPSPFFDLNFIFIITEVIMLTIITIIIAALFHVVCVCLCIWLHETPKWAPLRTIKFNGVACI